MNFIRVELLYLIWILPLLLAAMWLGMNRRRRILSRFSSPHGLQSIAPAIRAQRHWLKAGLLLAAVCLTIIALAGPRYGYRWQEVQRKGVDIILVLDCSRSMLATDIRPNRLSRAKREIYDLLTRLRGDRIGLVAFAGTAFLQCPLTVDYDAFYLFLNALTPDFLPVGGTDLSGAILTAVEAFDQKTYSEKAVILITDGENTAEDKPLDAAVKARQAGIRIFTIGIGKPEGVPLPDPEGGFLKDPSGKIVLTRLDEPLLQKVAGQTNGAYVRSVAGDLDLEVIYNREIRAKLKAAEETSGRRKIWQDRFQWPLLAAAILILIELLIPSARRLTALAPFILCLTFNPPAMAGAWQEGLQAYQQERYEEALKYFLQVQVDDPQNPKLLYNLGNTYYRLGNYKAALEHYERAQAAAPEPLKQRSLYNAGNASYRNGMLEDAIRQYTAALQIDPDDRLARENLEFVKARLKEQPSEGGGNENNERQQDDPDKSNRSEASERQSERQKDPSNRQNRADDTGRREPDQSAAQQNQSARNNPQNSPPADPGSQARPPEQPPQEERPGGSRLKNGPGERDVSQAERILNRLQDQPGKALMPVYEKRRVEKDW